MLTDFDIGHGNMELFSRNNLAQKSGGGRKGTSWASCRSSHSRRKGNVGPCSSETAAQLIDIVVTEVGGITAKIHSRGWGAQRSWKCRENISRK